MDNFSQKNTRVVRKIVEGFKILFIEFGYIFLQVLGFYNGRSFICGVELANPPKHTPADELFSNHTYSKLYKSE